MPYKTNKPLSPAEVRVSTGSTYHYPGSKSANWYRRNIKKTLEPMEYPDSVEDAIVGSGLP
jgi:hypothetical protein